METTTTNGSLQASTLWPRSVSTPPTTGGTAAPDAGAGTSLGGAKQCRGIGHLQNQCPSRAGAASSRGKQTARGHYGSSSHVSTAASSSSGATGIRRRQSSTQGQGRRGEAVSLTARPLPPPWPPARGARGRATPRRRQASLPQQAGDRKHPVLLRRGGGGRRQSGAGQSGGNGSYKGGSQAPG